MTWHTPHILLALLLLPLVAGLWAYAARRQTAAGRQFAHPEMLRRLVPPPARRREWAKAAILLAAIGILIVAGARPRWGEYLEKTTQPAADLMVLLDVSRSMTAEDVPPNRLQRAKSDVRDLLDRLGGDRVGLVTFASTPALRAPLTTDYGFIRMILSEVGPQTGSRGGTRIGDGIRQCLKAMPERCDRDQAILLITDGEDHDSSLDDAVREAAGRGIKVFCVGLGDSRVGSRIPVREAESVHYLKHDGQEVWSKLEEASLRQIALATGGAYIPAGTKVYDLGQIYADHLAHLTRTKVDGPKHKRYRELFQVFLSLGLGLLLGEMLVSWPTIARESSPEPTSSSRRVGESPRHAVTATIGLILFLSMASFAQSDPAAKHVEEGIAHFRHGDYAEAASSFQQAHQGRPDDLRIVFDRACALTASGSVTKAAELFQEAAQSPEPAVAAASHYNLGNVAANKARALFGPHPEDASAQVRQDGLALLTEALSHYRDCLAVAPDQADARYNEELIRRWIEHMQSVWREREKQSHSTSTTTADQSKRQCDSGTAVKKKSTTDPGPEQQPTHEDTSANPSQAKPKEAKNPDPTKQQAEAVLRKVRERQQYRRAIERSSPQSSIRPMAVDKDW